MPTEGPRLLLVETSGRLGRVGLASGMDVLAERTLDESRRHARDLAPTIASLLDEHGWRPRDLSAVVVSLGPGSYTGLRVGIMSAKAFAYATGCAVVGVPTFEVIARQADAVVGAIDVIADAQQQKLYVQRFARPADGSVLSAAGELAVVPGREWANNRNPGVPVTGPGLRVAEAWLPEGTPTVPADRREPAVAHLSTAGLQRLARGYRDDPFRLEPIYLRPSSAEEQWDRRS
jgi:tRNA threonylcarbamoyladenosine biosynthesis protein TsaB